MKKTVSFICALCLFSLFAFALTNVEVKGKITDSSGLILEGAEIVVKNTSHIMKTDSKGEFSFTLPEGKYVLTISKTLYAPKTVVLEVKHNTQLDLDLEKIKKSDTSRL